MKTLRDFINYAKRCNICRAPMQLDFSLMIYPKLMATKQTLTNQQEYITFFDLNKNNDYQFAVSLGLDQNDLYFHNPESEQKFFKILEQDDAFSYLTVSCTNDKCHYAYSSSLIIFDIPNKTFDEIELFSESLIVAYKNKRYTVESYFRSKLTEVYLWPLDDLLEGTTTLTSFIPLKVFQKLSKKKIFNKISNIILLT